MPFVFRSMAWAICAWAICGLALGAMPAAAGPSLPAPESVPDLTLEVPGPPVPAGLEEAQAALERGQAALALDRARAFLGTTQDRKLQARAQDLIGAALLLQNRLREAREALEEAVRLDPAYPPALIRLCNLAAAENRQDDAIACYRSAQKLDPDNRLVHRRLGALLARKGETAAALRELEAGLGAGGDAELGARIDLASLYDQEGRPAEAARVLSPVVTPESRSVPGLVLLGSAQLALGRADLALPLFRAAVKLAPDDGGAVLGLGAAERQSGETADAVRTLETFRDRHPDSVAGLYQLGLAYLAASRYADAKQTLAAAAKLDPAGAAAESAFSGRFGLGQDAEQGIAAVRTLADSATATLGGYVALANAYLGLGRPDAAERAFRDAAARWPADPQAAWRLASLLAYQARYDEAYAVLQDGLARSPKDPRLLRTATLVLTRQGRTGDAVRMAERLVAADPENAESRILLAAEYEQAGQTAKAADIYRAVLERRSDAVVALNNLAALLTGSGHARDAVPLARRAAALVPDNPNVADTLGSALLQDGNPGEAVKAFQTAVAGAPDNPEYRYRLALAQRAAGDLAAARESLRAALASPARFADRGKAEASMAELEKAPR